MSFSRREAAAALLAASAAGLTPGWARGQDLTQTAIPEPATPLDPTEDPDFTLATTGDPFANMVAPVTINGQGPYDFLIDTGANVSCVSRKLAQQLGLEPTAPAKVHSVVGVQTRPAVLIHQLRVGERDRRRVRAPSLPLQGTDLGGLLGVDWLKGQRLTLNLRENKIDITRSRAETPKVGSVIVPAKLRWGQLTIVDADMNGRDIQALIDSGSEVALCNDKLRELVTRIDPSQAPGKVKTLVHLQTIMGEPFVGEQIYLPFLRLGGVRMGNVPVVHADAHVFKVWGVDDRPALVLGMDLLSEFRSVSMDFGRRTVRFDV